MTQEIAANNQINFYTTKSEFGFLTNFARHPLLAFGRMWMTSEHAYQAQKFAGMKQEDYDAVHSAINPMAAAIVGRDTNRACRPDWDEIKDDVMRYVVLEKFMQNPDIKLKLLETGDRILVEHDTKRHDKYWGDGGDGTGLNRLGCILMEVREVIREHDKWSEMSETDPATDEGTSDALAGYICSLDVRVQELITANACFPNEILFPEEELNETAPAHEELDQELRREG
jgi:N-glycosidase YbiA